MGYIIAIPPASDFTFTQDSVSASILLTFPAANAGTPSNDGIMDWYWSVNSTNHTFNISLGQAGKRLHFDGLETDILPLILNLLSTFPQEAPFLVLFDQGYNFHLELTPETTSAEIENAWGN